MKETKYNVQGLMYHTISDKMLLVVDTRERKTRYVGLICNIPFGFGYMACPFVRKRLRFDIPMNQFPKGFKNVNRCWNFIRDHTTGFDELRKYTIFNPLIKILGFKGIMLYDFIQEVKLHVGISNIIFGGFLAFYPTESIIAAITTKTIAAIIGSFGIVNLVVAIHDRKAGHSGGNRNSKSY